MLAVYEMVAVGGELLLAFGQEVIGITQLI